MLKDSVQQCLKCCLSIILYKWFRPTRISFQEPEIKNEAAQISEAYSNEEHEIESPKSKKIKLMKKKRARGRPNNLFENGTNDDQDNENQSDSSSKLVEKHLYKFMISMSKPVNILIE